MAFGVSSYSHDVVQILIRFVLNAAILFFFILEIVKSQRYRFLKRYGFVFTLLCIMYLFGLYSSFNSTIVYKSVFKIYELCILISLCYLVSSRDDFRLLSSLNFSILIILTTGILSDILFGNPNLFELKGYFPLINSNTIGFMAGLLFLVNIETKNKVLLVLSFTLLLLSGSLTSLIITIFMACYFVFKARVFFLICFSGMAIFIYGFSFLVTESELEMILNFSGRKDLWDRIFIIYLDSFNFFSGVGLGAGRELNAEFYGGVPKSFHNAYLEILVSLGWIGLILIILIILVILRKVRYFTKSTKSIEMVLLLYILVRALSSSNLAFVSIDSFVFWLVYFYCFKYGDTSSKWFLERKTFTMTK